MIELLSQTNVAISPKLEKSWDRVFQLKDAKFFELPMRGELWAGSVQRAQEIQKSFDATCIVGIGGSSLGARALDHAFKENASHQLLFVESPDQTEMRKWERKLSHLSRVHFVFISKSGKTLETLALLDYFTQITKEAGLHLHKQSTVICGAAQSPLRKWAEGNKVPILPFPEDDGGRFSVLTPVGLLPAALMGLPLERLRAGAEWALKQKQLVLTLSAASMESFEEERWISQMWIYSTAFHTLGLWWQQLWSESLGKRQSRSGAAAPRVSTAMVCQGPQDQHSQLQQLQEGTRDKWVIAFRDEDAEKGGAAFECGVLQQLETSCKAIRLGEILSSEADGFLGALKEAGVPHIVLKGSSSKLESWGAFFMVWELVIGVLGEALEINAFDQPGVELGKRLAIQSLRQRL